MESNMGVDMEADVMVGVNSEQDYNELSEQVGHSEENVTKEVQTVTNGMVDKYKENISDEIADLTRFLDYTLEKNRVDEVTFMKDHYSFTYENKETEVEDSQSLSRSRSGDKFTVNIYENYVNIKVGYDNTRINCTGDIFMNYKDRFYDIYLKNTKKNISNVIGDVYKISGLDLKKSREDKIAKILGD